MEYTKADARHPQMGLDNKICIEPKYWCRNHQVWLSEKDVQKRECKKQMSYDMMSVSECGNLEKRNYEDWLKELKKNRKRG